MVTFTEEILIMENLCSGMRQNHIPTVIGHGNCRYLKPFGQNFTSVFHVRFMLHHLGTRLLHEDELSRIQNYIFKVHATVFTMIIVLMHVKYG